MVKIFYWEKTAYIPEDEKEDKLITDLKISDIIGMRNVIKELEHRKIGEVISFSQLEPGNIKVVKKLPLKLFDEFPKVNNDIAEIILDTFRNTLRTSSRKKRFIINLLVLNDVLVLAHCNQSKSLAQVKERREVVKNLLNPNNVIRAAIIRKSNNEYTFSAFARDRHIAKGFADFWGISPELIGIEVVSDVRLVLESDSFPYELILPLDSDQIDRIFDENIISPSGELKIKLNNARINRALTYKKEMKPKEFYSFYITKQENLD